MIDFLAALWQVVLGPFRALASMPPWMFVGGLFIAVTVRALLDWYGQEGAEA